MKIIIIVLSLICFGLLCYLLLIKKQIRDITGELKENRKEGYNKQARVQLFDRDLTELTKECNYNLDYQTRLKRKNRIQEETSKRAISDIAHDLRTPLTVVKGNLQLMEQEGNLGEKEQQYLQVCEAKTEELKYMVNEFFELSMLESDTSVAEISVVNITSLLMNVILEHELLIREQGLTPKLNLPEKNLLVQGNDKLLERIFENLLGNIFKYAKEQFSVSLIEETDCCKVEFSNPIEKENTIDVEHIFDRTYMADCSRHKTGTGLGLFIVKLLAEKQGAKVYARKTEDWLTISLELKK